MSQSGYINDREFSKFVDSTSRNNASSVETMPASFATIVDEVSKSLMYVGKAKIGSLQDSSVWQIQKITVTGSITLIQYADGDGNFDNVWNDRASLSYS